MIYGVKLDESGKVIAVLETFNANDVDVVIDKETFTYLAKNITNPIYYTEGKFEVHKTEERTKLELVTKLNNVLSKHYNIRQLIVVSDYVKHNKDTSQLDEIAAKILNLTKPRNNLLKEDNYNPDKMYVIYKVYQKTMYDIFSKKVNEDYVNKLTDILTSILGDSVK